VLPAGRSRDGGQDGPQRGLGQAQAGTQGRAGPTP
jgi:hypothetical protein